FTWKKLGIHLIHAGLVFLLLGQLLTDLLSKESAMRLAEGSSKNYSEDFRDNELVVINTSDPQKDEVIAIPEAMVAGSKEIHYAQLPVTLRVLNYWPNSSLYERPVSNSVPVRATHGAGSGLHLVPLKPTLSTEERNMPSAVVEVLSPQGSLGTWLVS